MLRAREVTVARARGAIVVDDLRVDAGEIAAIVGPNATGKTSVLRAFAGLDEHGGVVEVDGRDVTGVGAEERVRAGIALVPAGRRLFGRLTVAQNLVTGCTGLSRAQTRAAIAASFERFPILAGRSAQRAGTLSGGEGQVLMIARALVTAPKALLVDEPLEGLSTEATDHVLAVLQQVADDGAAVLLASPDPVPGARTITLVAVEVRA